MWVLVLNCGSSSVKFAVVNTADRSRALEGQVERLGVAGGEAHGRVEARGRTLHDGPLKLTTQGAAVHWLERFLAHAPAPEAVGHRVVHGGERYQAATPLDATVVAELEQLSRLAPLHNPPNLAGIRAACERFPRLPHVACFDTAFHATLPEHAYRYALPSALYREHGIRRYGFHGHSHRFVAERAQEMLGHPGARLVTMHLGNGCSAAAVRAGRSVDTSMGFTPLEGLVMGTRSGDLDPAVPLHLQAALGLSREAVERALNRDAGLRGLSGGKADMRDIEAAAAAGDAESRLAFDLFCYRAKKYVGAYAAVLGGLEALVFTGGIGENSAAVRAAVCSGLEFLGLRLDEKANGQNQETARDVSAAAAPARVLVIPTDEEGVIAREVEQALASTGTVTGARPGGLP